jgi:formamidopyrimidine-DNA glycosylase
MPANVTRVIIEFKDNSALYFNDLRKFGWVKVTNEMEKTDSVDVLDSQFTFDYFKKSVSGSRKPIKVLLLDQDKITGIGNIYDNDALWEAEIHPERKANTLTETELKNVYEGINKVIAEGIKYKGSSAQDEMYLLPNSEPGQYQHHFKVYHREGKECLRIDGGVIQRIKQGGRSSFFCPVCQR